MSKQVIQTQRVKDLIGKATDNSVNCADVAVFEVISLNTKPLSKKGSIFDQGTVSKNFLDNMASFLSNGGAVPVHTLHQQGYELPIGKTFYSEVLPSDNGNFELRSMFYVPLSEADLVNRIETDVINEVSVGVRAKQLCCSSCGFDFMGPDATWENLYDRTCGNDHVLGENGVHVIMDQLDNWMEQSLVSRGAANNAKILGRTKQSLGADTYNQLAASGVSPEMTTLFASITQPKQEKQMDLTVLIGELTAAKAEKLNLDAALAASKTAVSTLEASVTDLNTKLAAAVAAVDPLHEKTKTDLAAALGFVRAEADRLCVAAGEAKLADDATLDVLKASIEASRTKLSANFQTGGASATLSAITSSTTAKKAPSAFKAPK